MSSNGEQRTDKYVKIDVLKKAELERVKDEDWLEALNITLEDVYANAFCFRKDARYSYFIETMASSLRLIMKVKDFDK